LDVNTDRLLLADLGLIVHGGSSTQRRRPREYVLVGRSRVDSAETQFPAIQ